MYVQNMYVHMLYGYMRVAMQNVGGPVFKSERLLAMRMAVQPHESLNESRKSHLTQAELSHECDLRDSLPRMEHHYAAL